MAHGASRNFAALSWYAGASAPGSINVRPMHGPIPPPLRLSRSRYLSPDPEKISLPSSLSISRVSDATRASCRSRAPCSGATIVSPTEMQTTQLQYGPGGARIKPEQLGIARHLTRKHKVSLRNQFNLGWSKLEIGDKGRAREKSGVYEKKKKMLD